LVPTIPSSEEAGAWGQSPISLETAQSASTPVLNRDLTPRPYVRFCQYSQRYASKAVAEAK